MAFESLSERLNGVFKKLRGKGKLSEADIKAAMREVRMALLEADVNYKVAKDFCAQVSERAMGQEVMESLTPAQQVVKIVNEELTKLMGGEEPQTLHIKNKGQTVMMMSGNPDLPKNVKFTVADCGYTSPWAEFDYQLKNAHVPTSPLLDGANFFNKHIAKYDFKKVDAVESVSHAQVPMLFIHGTKDDFVPTYMVHELYDACSTDKDLLLVEGAGHAESYPTDSAAYEAKDFRAMQMLDWFESKA